MQSKHILIGAITVLVLAVLLLLFQPQIEERLQPQILAAHVAIRADDGAAVVGRPVALEVGTTFTLHAVLEADDGSGQPLYYSEAPALRIGDVEVPPERLRRFDRSLRTRVRWFTVEGSPSYLELGTAADLDRFQLREIYRSDWPLAWSVPGVLEAAKNDSLATQERTGSSLGGESFGTQRYLVAVELYQATDELLPSRTVRSAGAAEALSAPARFPTVRRSLPGALAPSSRAFGLAHLEALAGADELLQRVAELADAGLAFSRVTVIRDTLRAADRSFAELEWRTADLGAGEARWGVEVAAGDLLRVGERLVLLYADRGQPGRLDKSDLCFDFALGAAVRSLDEVFAGGGVVEVASLGPGGEPADRRPEG